MRWRAVEYMYWMLGKHGLAQRTGVRPFITSSENPKLGLLTGSVSSRSTSQPSSQRLIESARLCPSGTKEPVTVNSAPPIFPRGLTTLYNEQCSDLTLLPIRRELFEEGSLTQIPQQQQQWRLLSVKFLTQEGRLHDDLRRALSILLYVAS